MAAPARPILIRSADILHEMVLLAINTLSLTPHTKMTNLLLILLLQKQIIYVIARFMRYRQLTISFTSDPL